MAWCYLIHFERPVGRFKHYLGYTTNLAQRWGDHKAGRGSRLTKAAVRQGIRMTLARLWSNGSKHLEIELKRANNFKRHCPICLRHEIGKNLASS
jgi:predicted GIY-YIG superfamily endonuclease